MFAILSPICYLEVRTIQERCPIMIKDGFVVADSGVDQVLDVYNVRVLVHIIFFDSSNTLNLGIEPVVRSELGKSFIAFCNII